MRSQHWFKSRPKGPPGDESLARPYERATKRFPLMDRETEHRAAQALVAARRELWSSICEDRVLRIRLDAWLAARQLPEGDRPFSDLAARLAQSDAAGRLADEFLTDAETEVFRAPTARPRKKLARLRQLRSDFANANLRLVIAVASEQRGRGVAFPDLVQEGNVGLLMAVDRFDAERGVRFATYAVWWIRHLIKRHRDAQASPVRVPAHQRRASARLFKAREELAAKLGRLPEDAELGAALGIDARGLERLRSAIDAADPSRFVELSAASRLSEDRDPDDALVAHELQTLLEGARLSESERRVIDRRLSTHAPTLAQLGKELGVSRERIRQLESSAATKLRRLSER